MVLSFFIPLVIGCGGGSDIGNPGCTSFGYVTGKVYNSDGTPANNAMIMLGPEGTSFGSDTQIVRDSAGLIIFVRSLKFDTIYSDTKGQFTFENIIPGHYVVVASKNSKLGIESITSKSNEYSTVNVTLGTPADILIKSKSFPTSSPLSFKAAQISGTSYLATPDSFGNFRFNSIPSGVLDIVLYKSNDSIETFRQFVTEPGCSAVLVADPNRSTDYWTPEDCGPRDYQGRPYITFSSPPNASTGNDAKVNIGQSYEVHIQFSHSMDTRLTSNALKVFSSDNSISLDSKWWQGDDEVFISFCTKDSSDTCTRVKDYFRKGVKYSVVVDTTAQTIAGVKFASPDTIWFIPEP